MAKRIQIQNPVTPPPITPAAAPVNTFTSPRLPPPVLQTVIDLSPLSETLTSIAAKETRDANAVAKMRGSNYAATATDQQLEDLAGLGKGLTEAEIARRTNQEAYAKGIANGTLKPEDSPHAVLGFYELAGRRLGMRYAAALAARQDELASVTDENGDPIPPADIQAAMGKEWEKFSSNAILQSPYAAQEALGIKTEAEGRFLQSVQAVRGANRVKAQESLFTNELSLKFTQVADSGKVEAKDFSAIEDYVLQQGRLRSIQNPRGLVLKAARATAASLATTDPQHAADFLRQIREVKVGNTTLANDAATGEEISAAIIRFENMAEADGGKEARLAAQALSKATRKAQTDFYPQLLDAYRAGESVDAHWGVIDDKLRSENTYGEQTPAVREQLRQYAESLKRVRDEDSQRLKEELAGRIAHGDPEVADVLEAQYESGSLHGADYLALRDLADRRKDLSPLLDNNRVYTSAVADIAREDTVNTRGLPGDAQAEWSASSERIVNRFKEDAATAAQSFRGKPNEGELMREWVDKNQPKALEQIRARVQQFEQQSTVAREKIGDAISRSQDARPLIDQYRHLLPADDAERLRARSDAFSDRTRFFQSPEYQQAAHELDQQVKMALTGGDATLMDERTLDASSEIRAELRRRTDAYLAEILPTAAPNAVAGMLNTKLLELRKELVTEARSIVQPTLAAEASADAQAKAAADSAALTPAQYADQVAARKDPLVEGSYYKLLRGYLAREPIAMSSGMHAVSFGLTDFMITHDEMHEAVGNTVNKLLSKPGLDPVARSQSIADVYAPIGGIRAGDILNGQLPVRLTEGATFDTSEAMWTHRAYLSSKLSLSGEQVDQLYNLPAEYPKVYGFLKEHGRANLNAGTWDLEASRVLSLLRARDRATGKVAVPLEGVKIDPYMTPLFQSLDEFDIWRKTMPAKLRDVAGRLGVPADDVALEAWAKSQVQAIKRLPNAR